MPRKKVHQRAEEYAFEEIKNSLKQDEYEQHKLVIKYYRKGISIKKISEITDTSITQIIGILRCLDETLEDIDEGLDENEA